MFDILAIIQELVCIVLIQSFELLVTEEPEFKISLISPVPRLLFDKWTASDFHAIVSNEDAMNELVNTVVNFMKVCTFFK